VPLIPEIREGGDSGTPIVVSKPESAAGHTFREIAGELLSGLAKPALPRM
jgi:ATP-binding protein involved in chromosome partitioning